MECLLAGAIAAVLTLFDLDRAFYVPARFRGKLALYCWWWGFVLLNGALAAALYFPTSQVDAFKGISPWVRALAVGFGYLAVIRMKLATVPVEGSKDGVPLGPEYFYNQAKAFFFKRINAIARDARVEETLQLAKASALGDLVSRANALLQQDALLSPDQRRAVKEWMLQVVKDTAATDDEKRLLIATYILTGQRPD